MIFYLREKLKKRPVFAMDQKPYEASVRNYRKGANKIPKTAHIEVFVTEARFCLIMKRVTLTNNARAEQIFLERTR